MVIFQAVVQGFDTFDTEGFIVEGFIIGGVDGFGANLTKPMFMNPRSYYFSQIRSNNKTFFDNLQGTISQLVSHQSVQDCVRETARGVRPFKNFIIGVFRLYKNFFTQLMRTLPLRSILVAFENYFVGVFTLFHRFFTELLEETTTGPYVSGVIFATILMGVIHYPLRILDGGVVVTIALAGIGFLASLMALY